MNPFERGEHALRQAERATKRGDLASAERWTKVALQSAASAERLSASTSSRGGNGDDLTDDQVREELMRKLTRFAGLAHDMDAWEREQYAHRAAVEISRRTGAPLPPPLRPHPAGRPEDAEARLIEILQRPEPSSNQNEGR